jgi:hypothetical protein
MQCCPDEKDMATVVANWESLCAKHLLMALKKKFSDAGRKSGEDQCKVQLEKSELQDEIESVERIVAEMESIAQSAPQQVRPRYLQAIHLKKEWDKPWPLARKRKAELHDAFIIAFETFMTAYHELKEQNSWHQWANEIETRLVDESGNLKSFTGG